MWTVSLLYPKEKRQNSDIYLSTWTNLLCSLSWRQIQRSGLVRTYVLWCEMQHQLLPAELCHQQEQCCADVSSTTASIWAKVASRPSLVATDKKDCASLIYAIVPLTS